MKSWVGWRVGVRRGGGETYLHIVFAHGGRGVQVRIVLDMLSDGLWGLVERVVAVASECSCDRGNDGGRKRCLYTMAIEVK